MKRNGMPSHHFPSIADKFIEIGNLRIAYKDEGRGQVILCLHALGHSSKDFLSLYDLPITDYRIVSIDFPGQGKSEGADQPASSAFYAQIAAACIEALGLKDIAIVGNSIGGATAIRLASNNPNVAMLSLSNPAGLDKKGWLAPIFLHFMVRFFQKGVAGKAFFPKMFARYYNFVLSGKPALARKQEIVQDAVRLAPLLVQGWKSFKLPDEDLRPLIETVRCPVLFTWGVKDLFVQFGRNKKAIEKFPDHELIKYPIGHTPYIECPELFLNDFRAFLQKTIPPQ
jgi:pimeloyl-ACP methyl ester carboxylesterase